MCLKFVVVGLLLLCGTTSLGIQVVDMNHESSNVKSHTPDPPPKNETARMARYIVHYSGKKCI